MDESPLKIARRAAGFSSARQAALRHNWNVNTYKAHEAGVNGMDVETATKYADAFNADLLWVLKGMGREPQAAPSQTPRPRLPEPNASATMQAPDFAGARLPVLGEAVGGEEGLFRFNGEPHAWIERPPSLVDVPKAYAVYVAGESMSPRYEAGDTVWVNPFMPPNHTSDVVVQVKPETPGDPPEGYIKRFSGWRGNKLRLSQFNPVETFEIDKALIVSVHTIVGRLNR